MAFKQKGFSAHAGVAKQHMGSDRGSAVFMKPSAFPSTGHRGVPDPKDGHAAHEWQAGEEHETGRKTDEATGDTTVSYATDYSREFGNSEGSGRGWNEGYKAWLAKGNTGSMGDFKTEAERWKQTQRGSEEDQATREEVIPGAPKAEPKHSMRVSKHPGWPNHGGPVRNSAGDIQDASGVIGMEVDGEMYNFPWASHGRSGQRNKSMEDLKVSNPEAYEEAINMAAESGYSGGGSDADLKVNGGGWDQTRYDTTSARNPGEEPGWTPEGGRTTKEMRANPTQSVASPSTYEGEVAEPLMDPSIFKKGRSPLFKKGYRTKSWI